MEIKLFCFFFEKLSYRALFQFSSHGNCIRMIFFNFGSTNAFDIISFLPLKSNSFLEFFFVLRSTTALFPPHSRKLFQKICEVPHNLFLIFFYNVVRPTFRFNFCSIIEISLMKPVCLVSSAISIWCDKSYASLDILLIGLRSKCTDHKPTTNDIIVRFA